MSLADDTIDDSDIGPLCSNHFPRIGENAGSKVIVLSLVYIIEDQAKTGAANGNWSDLGAVYIPPRKRPWSNYGTGVWLWLRTKKPE